MSGMAAASSRQARGAHAAAATTRQARDAQAATHRARVTGAAR